VIEDGDLDVAPRIRHQAAGFLQPRKQQRLHVFAQRSRLHRKRELAIRDRIRLARLFVSLLDHLRQDRQRWTRNTAGGNIAARRSGWQ